MTSHRHSKGKSKNTTDLLLRGIDNAVYAKLRAAAALHNMYMSSYVMHLIEQNLRDLEQAGVQLDLTGATRTPPKHK